jgi:hypothetical protein
MPLHFVTQCCDASYYLARGKQCALTGQCWDPLRPGGTVFYFSLPFSLGLPAEGVIVEHALFVTAAAICAYFVLLDLLGPARGLVTKIVAFAAVVAVHVGFMRSLVFTAISDAPAGAAALMGIWLLVLSHTRKKFTFAIAGCAALGVALSLRAFYLYPALLTVVVVFVQAARDNVRPRRLAVACAAVVVPIAVQVTASHENSRTFTFIDSRVELASAHEHFDNAIWGYDTVLSETTLTAQYDAPECFARSSGFGDAVSKHEWVEALCLVWRRQRFYFGSFVPYGRVYLTDVTDRVFSRDFIAWNVLAFALVSAFILESRERRRAFLAPVVLLAAIHGEASLILPETRFVVALYVALWILFAVAAESFGRRAWTAYRARGEGSVVSGT